MVGGSSSPENIPIELWLEVVSALDFGDVVNVVMAICKSTAFRRLYSLLRTRAWYRRGVWIDPLLIGQSEFEAIAAHFTHMGILVQTCSGTIEELFLNRLLDPVVDRIDEIKYVLHTPGPFYRMGESSWPLDLSVPLTHKICEATLYRTQKVDEFTSLRDLRLIDFREAGLDVSQSKIERLTITTTGSVALFLPKTLKELKFRGPFMALDETNTVEIHKKLEVLELNCGRGLWPSFPRTFESLRRLAVKEARFLDANLFPKVTDVTFAPSQSLHDTALVGVNRHLQQLSPSILELSKVEFPWTPPSNDLKNLTLHLSDPVDEIDFSEFDLANLTHLKLTNRESPIEISAPITKLVGLPSSITNLALHGCFAIPDWSSLPCLSQIDLDRVHIPDQSIDFSNNHKLRRLGITSSLMTSVVVAQPNVLEEINFIGNNLARVPLTGSFPRLTVMNASRNPIIHLDPMTRVNFPKLNNLVISSTALHNIPDLGDLPIDHICVDSIPCTRYPEKARRLTIKLRRTQMSSKYHLASFPSAVKHLTVGGAYRGTEIHYRISFAPREPESSLFVFPTLSTLENLTSVKLYAVECLIDADSPLALPRSLRRLELNRVKVDEIHLSFPPGDTGLEFLAAIDCFRSDVGGNTCELKSPWFSFASIGHSPRNAGGETNRKRARTRRVLSHHPRLWLLESYSLPSVIGGTQSSDFTLRRTPQNTDIQCFGHVNLKAVFDPLICPPSLLGIRYKTGREYTVWPNPNINA
ncbi:hypothetical protein DICA4_A07844 [Diutina catenulata]